MKLIYDDETKTASVYDGDKCIFSAVKKEYVSELNLLADAYFFIEYENKKKEYAKYHE